MINTILEKTKSIFQQKFVKDTSWTFIATLIVGFSGLILQTLVANNHAATGLGIYSQVLAIYTLFTLLAGFGIELSTIKHTAEFKDDHQNLIASFSTSQLILLFFSTIIATSLYLISTNFPNVFSSEEVARGIKYVCPGIVFFILNRNSNSLLTGLRKMNIYAISRSLRWLMILIFSLIIILFIDDKINYLLIVYSLSEFLLFIILAVINNKYYRIHISKNWLRVHLRYGSKSILARLASDFNHKLGILIVGYFIGNAAAGIFSFMVIFGQAILIFSSSVQKNFNPFFAHHFAKNRVEHIKSSINKLLKFTLASAIPLYIISNIGYIIYVKTFLSYDFHNTIYMFGILTIGIIVSFTMSWTATMLSMAGLLNQNLIRIITGSMFYLLMLSILTKLLQTQGAIIATSISHIFNVGLSLYFVKRFLAIDVLSLASGIIKGCSIKK
ncbi:MAG: oligosaccharide flippase family protein [Candidatus Marinimicrobia bacterium]|nr:oligosaccharide flippase family protein [Candidatus Neomarinimicrobiota bacterium]